MSDDTEWGPWIGWNGGERPVEGDAVFQQVWINEDGSTGRHKRSVTGFGYAWDNVIAYRVKEEPVIESVQREVRLIDYANGDILTTPYDATCTYRDGKLISINWEAPDA